MQMKEACFNVECIIAMRGVCHAEGIAIRRGQNPGELKNASTYWFIIGFTLLFYEKPSSHKKIFTIKAQKRDNNVFFFTFAN